MSYVGEWILAKNPRMEFKKNIEGAPSWFGNNLTWGRMYIQEIYLGMGQAVVRFKEYKPGLPIEKSTEVVSIPYHNINYLHYEIAEQEVNNKV